MTLLDKEVDFPREGASSNADKPKRPKKQKENEDSLFGVPKKKPAQQQPTGKKNKRVPTELPVEDGAPKKKKKTEPSAGCWTMPMKADLMNEGVMGLGVVAEIRDDRVMLQTVDNVKLQLPINCVGKKFFDELKAGSLGVDNVFSVGQMVPFKVLKPKEQKEVNGKKQKKWPTVSCDPAVLNNHLTPAMLLPGLVIHGIVSSREEKGFILDVGLKSVQAFLPSDKVPAQQQLIIGQPMLVRIENFATRIIRVTSFVEQDHLAEDVKPSLTLNNLMPGTILECEPSEEEDRTGRGVFVELGNDVRAFINLRHLPPRLRSDTSKFVRSLRAAVMICQQNANMLVLSAHPDVVAVSKPERRSVFQGYNAGDRLTCTVASTQPSQFTVNFSLPISDDGKIPLVTAVCRKEMLHKHDDIENMYPPGSEHDCRVVGFNMVERTMLVTTRKDYLKQKIVSYKEAKPGQLVTATVTALSDGGAQVLVDGLIRGFIPRWLAMEKQRPIEKIFTIGGNVKARVFELNEEGQELVLTTKSSLVKSKVHHFTNYDQSNIGKEAAGTVVSFLPNNGVLVMFYNRVKGVLQREEHEKIGKLKIGQVVTVRISSIEEHARGFKVRLVAPGEAATVEVKKVSVEGTEATKKSKKVEKTVEKPVSEEEESGSDEESSEDEDEENKSERKSKAELGIDTKSVRNLKLYTCRVEGKWSHDDAQKYSPSRLSIELKMPGGTIGRLHVSELPAPYLVVGTKPLDVFLAQNMHKEVNVRVFGFSTIHLQDGTKVKVADVTMNREKLTAKNRGKKLNPTENFVIGNVVTCFGARPSTKATDSVNVIVNLVTAGRVPKETLGEDLTVSNPNNASHVLDLAWEEGEMRRAWVMATSKGRMWNTLTLSMSNKNVEDSCVSGRLVRVNALPLSLLFALPGGKFAKLTPTGIATNYMRIFDNINRMDVGEVYRLHILSKVIELGDKKKKLSGNLFVVTEGRYEKQKEQPIFEDSEHPTPGDVTGGKNPLILNRAELKEGETYNGFVTANEPDAAGIFVELGPGVTGRMKKPENTAYGEIPVNAVVSVSLSKIFDDGRMNLTFKKVLLKPSVPVKQDAAVEKRKRTSSKSEEDAAAQKIKVENVLRSEDMETIEMADPGFDFTNEGFRPEDLAAVGKIGKAVVDESDHSNEENLTPAAKKKLARERKLAAAREKAAASTSTELEESDEDFSLLLQREPNSSSLWIRYMSLFLGKGKLTEAREAAERALTSIHYREEDEIFNVWTAYLNMEVSYGTEESTKAVFDRACLNCDSLRVHKQMAAIFAHCDKNEAADEVHESMIKRFRANTDEVWTLFGEHLFRTNRVDEARELMQRALKSATKEKHVQIISRFAQMEYKHEIGDAERGRTLFETLLSTYPKKTDLWSVYADLSLKYEGIEKARQVLERVCEQESLGIRKLRPLFKKWMEAEEKYGDEQSRSAVREKAGAFLENSTKAVLDE